MPVLAVVVPGAWLFNWQQSQRAVSTTALSADSATCGSLAVAPRAGVFPLDDPRSAGSFQDALVLLSASGTVPNRS